MYKQFCIRALYALSVLCLTACTEEFSDQPPLGGEMAVNATLGELHRLVSAPAVRIEEELVVSGRVTSSDEARNFYRTLIIQEEDHAVEVMVGLDKLHNDYPIGAKIYLRLKGLTAARQHGILQVGEAADPSSGFATDYLRSKAAVDSHILRSASPLAELQPLPCRLSDLHPAMCGLRLRIEGLRVAPETDDEPMVWSGYHRFTDREGRFIYSYVRPYADFADEPLPCEEGALTGILQYDESGEGRYLLKPNDASDFQP